MRRLRSVFRDIVILDAFHMGEEEMREYVGVLNRRRPACLDGYKDAIFALAEFVERVLDWFDQPSGIEGGEIQRLALSQNVPNLFNPKTEIAFTVPEGRGT